MRRELAMLTAAAALGALGVYALEHWLRPTAAYAEGPGRLEPRADGTVVVNAGETTLRLDRDGSVQVSGPKRLILGAADDVLIEGYRVKIDASSDVEIEGSRFTVDANEQKLEGSRIEVGDYSAEVTLADGSDPVCINDGGAVVKSQRVRAR